jgi:hypothetical protein
LTVGPPTATREDRILAGALDTHAHGYPEFTLRMPPRVDNVKWAELALEAGMRGFVIKSHIWPTTVAVHMLRSLYPQLESFASITLNSTVGGLNPVAVELAAQSGARVVWMPTWSAAQDEPHTNIYLERMRSYMRALGAPGEALADPVTVVDAEGRLLPAALAIVRLCHDYGLTLATGHIPVRASLALSAEAAARGVSFVFTHPLSGSVLGSIEDQLTVVRNGGFVEHVFVGCMPMHQRADPRSIVEAIEAVGPEHCIMATDAIEGWNPPAPEVMRMFIASMLALGVDEDAVHLMTHDNPARALGLPIEAPAE